MTITAKLTATLQANIDKLAQAKKSMDDWKAYALGIEEAIADELEKEQGIVVNPVGVEDVATVKVGEHLVIVGSIQRDWDQGCLAELAVSYPDLIGSILVREFKPASKEKVDKFITHDTPAAKALAGCFEETPRKSSFRVTR